MAGQSGNELVDITTGLPASLSDNLGRLGFNTNTTTGPQSSTEGQSTVENSSGSKNESGSQSTNTINTTPQGLAALNSLFQSLLNGGTPEQQATTLARQTEIGRTRQLRDQYSPDAASATGNALIAKAIKDALLQLMPTITAASEGSGTSKGSMRALLVQQAGEKGAIEGAAQAADLSAKYGSLQSQFEATLNELTKQDPNSPIAQLANLIIGTKGIVSSSTTVSNTSGRTNTSGNKDSVGGKDTSGTDQFVSRTPTGLNRNGGFGADADTFNARRVAAGGTNDGSDVGEGSIAIFDIPDEGNNATQGEGLDLSYQSLVEGDDGYGAYDSYDFYGEE